MRRLLAALFFLATFAVPCAASTITLKPTLINLEHAIVCTDMDMAVKLFGLYQKSEQSAHAVVSALSAVPGKNGAPYCEERGVIAIMSIPIGMTDGVRNGLPTHKYFFIASDIMWHRPLYIIFELLTPGRLTQAPHSRGFFSCREYTGGYES